MEIIEKIRKEIENAREQLEDSNYYLDNSEQALGYSAALDDMSKAINSFIREEMSKNMDEIVMTPLEILSKKCKQEEIDPKIAQCIADHWWEMVDGKEETPTDLEGEIKTYFGKWYDDEDLGLCKEDGWTVIVKDIYDLAIHFYELGKTYKESLHIPEKCKENPDSLTSVEEAVEEYTNTALD